MTNLFDLSGKRALVTGSSQGIGLAIAAALAEFGADVMVIAPGMSPRPRRPTKKSSATGSVAGSPSPNWRTRKPPRKSTPRRWPRWGR